MAKFVVIFLCFALIHAGSAIKCYNCQSSPTNDCTDYSKISSVECNPPRRDSPLPLCIRRVLKSAAGTNITLQCIENQTQNQCDPPSNNYEVTDCRICQEDMCNSSAKISLSLATIFGFTVAFLLEKWFFKALRSIASPLCTFYRTLTFLTVYLPRLNFIIYLCKYVAVYWKQLYLLSYLSV